MCDAALSKLLLPHRDTVLARLQEHTTCEGFIKDLKGLVRQVLLVEGSQSVSRPMIFHKAVLRQIDVIGWDQLVNIAPDFSWIEIQVLDSKQRPHLLRLQFPTVPPFTPAVDASLPRGASEPPRTESIASIITWFQEELERFQKVWDVLDDIDAHCWVLEPESPDRAALTRRVALGLHMSLDITVDARLPYSYPSIHFFGPESKIVPLRDGLHERLGQWNMNHTPRENLQILLRHEFPSKQEHSIEDFSLECGVCYSYKLENGEIPTKSCEHAPCGRSFHFTCLHEWLRSLPSSRMSFGTIFGTCPYCTSPITVQAK